MAHIHWKQKSEIDCLSYQKAQRSGFKQNPHTPWRDKKGLPKYYFTERILKEISEEQLFVQKMQKKTSKNW